jgi:hypothetical protein
MGFLSARLQNRCFWLIDFRMLPESLPTVLPLAFANVKSDSPGFVGRPVTRPKNQHNGFLWLRIVKLQPTIFLKRNNSTPGIPLRINSIRERLQTNQNPAPCAMARLRPAATGLCGICPANSPCLQVLQDIL